MCDPDGVEEETDANNIENMVKSDKLEIIPHLLNWIEKRELDPGIQKEIKSRLCSSIINQQMGCIFEISAWKLLIDHGLDARLQENVENAPRDITLYHNNNIFAIIEVVSINDSKNHQKMLDFGETLRQKAREAGLKGVLFEINGEAYINKLTKPIFDFVRNEFMHGKTIVNLQKSYALPVIAKQRDKDFPAQISYPPNWVDYSRLNNKIREKAKQHHQIKGKYPLIIAIFQESIYNRYWYNILKVIDSVSNKISGFFYFKKSDCTDNSIIFSRINYFGNPCTIMPVDQSLFSFVPCGFIVRGHNELIVNKWTRDASIRFSVSFDD